MKSIFTIIFFHIGLYLGAQSTNITTFFMSDWQKAEIYYEKFAYKNAIELYERVLDKNPNDNKAKIRIAECYTELNEPVNAIIWYSETVGKTDLITPMHLYNYAQALLVTKDYVEAKKWFEAYEELIPQDTRPSSKIQFIENIDYYIKDKSQCDISSMPYNSANSDFGAVPFEKGVLFLSARDQDLFIKYRETDASALDDESQPSEARLDLYYTYFADTAYTVPEKFHGINTRFHEGPVAFFHHGRKVIFTRNNFSDHKKKVSSDGKIKLKLFTTERDENNEWGEIIPFPYNNDEYSVGHPSLSQDDKVLFFSSDMPGGFGGSDLYYCLIQNGKWGKPVNMGPEINTRGDELFPFISHDDKLYFSSDGHGGFGGLDIYRTYRLKEHVFGSVENIGTPYNSSFDDFSFMLKDDGRNGYFSSNRRGGQGGDDIYEFNIRSLEIAGKVIETRRQIPVPMATVTVYDSLKNKSFKVVTDKMGYFTTYLAINSRYSFEAEKEGYSPQGYANVTTEGNILGTDTLNIYMWRHELFAEGRIFSNESHELLEKVTVTIDNLTDEETRQIETSSDGTYFFILQPEKKYEITANTSDHIPNGFSLNTSNLVEDTLRNDIVLEETYTNKDIIFFDFDQYSIKPEAVSHLEQMANVLKKHKQTVIVISAHADAQGTFEYNKKLSDLRAKSVVNYLRDQGISSKRISWFGFGEELPLNKCSDGVECNEEDYSKNRRAELKIGDPKTELTQ